MLGDAVTLAFVHREGERPGRACARGILTGGFADHSIRLTGFLRNPRHIVFNVLEVHAHRRLSWPLRVTRFAGNTGTAGTIITIGNLDPGFFDIGVKLSRRHLKTTDGYWRAEGHLMDRAFIGLATDFILWRTHHKTARGQYHHFRTMLAVFEDGAGRICMGCRCAEQGE